MSKHRSLATDALPRNRGDAKPVEMEALAEAPMASVKLYKLTDQDDRTYNNTQWGEGVKHVASGKGELCTDGWIHAYTDPLLAVLLNPIHANIQNAHLWEAEGEIGMDDHGLKVGCASLTTIRRIDVPVVTTEQRVRFTILCARTLYTETTWTTWADAWLSGVDRSAEAAWAARTAAWAAGAAVWAAGAAAEAAARATKMANFNLPELAREAITGR